MNQQLIWTALPCGFDDDTGLPRITAHLSPRLMLTPAELSSGKNQLATFPAFLDWPAVMAGASFEVIFDGGPTLTAQPLATNALNSQIWAALFPPETPVQPFEFNNMAERAFRSYPAAEAMSYVKKIYSTLAATADDGHPNLDSPVYADIHDKLGPITHPTKSSGQDSTFVQLNALMDSALAKPKKKTPVGATPKPRILPPAPITGFSDPLQYTFVQAERFYRRPENAETLDQRMKGISATNVPKPPENPPLDFHQRLATLSDHPTLSRRLGLVVDLVIKTDKPLPATGKVRFRIKTTRLDTPARQPATQFLFSRPKGIFTAAPIAGSDIVDGQLELRNVNEALSANIQNARYALSQADCDGSVLKLLQFTQTLVSLRTRRYKNEPDTTPAPVIRSNGINLLQRARAYTLFDRLARNIGFDQKMKNDTPDQIVFSADDVVRGYRVDVWEDLTKQWHSLCMRKGTYLLGRGNARIRLEISEEGYLKHATASSENDSEESDLYLHESLFGYEGWSLVAPRPRQPLSAETKIDKAKNTVHQDDFVKPPSPARNNAADFPLLERFAAQPGTLPRLRFGGVYRFRARFVDIAGNSPAPDLKDESHASDPVRFGRFEPVPAPAVVPLAVYSEGESLETLVIRSNYDASAASYAATPALTDLSAKRPFAYTAYNDRHFVPPKSAQQLCERHGRFDAAFGPGGSPTSVLALARREAATLFDTKQVDPANGALVPIPDVDIKVVSPASVLTPTTLPLAKPGDALQAGEYILHREAQMTTPYLPDPMSRDIAFLQLPGQAGADEVLHISWGNDQDWPKMRPIRLRIVERPGTIDDGNETFTDPGIPAFDEAMRVLTVQLPKATIAHVDFSSVFAKEDLSSFGLWGWLTAAQQKQVRELILAGRHWMFTPWRTLTLVHAVQQPLCVPRILAIATTKTTIGQTFALISASSHVSAKSTGQIDIEAWWQEPEDDLTRELPRTLTRGASVARLTVAYEADDDHALPEMDMTAIYTHSFQGGVKHEFGDTKHRKILYRLTATTRFREYFPPEITRDPQQITRQQEFFATPGDPAGAPLVPVAQILSSARPAAPRVHSVLPAFRWDRTNDGATSTHTRSGGCLRVWMERPWFSSGEGELLGIVYLNTVTPEVVNEMRPFVTQVGRDPINAAQAPRTGVDKGFFQDTPGAPVQHGAALTLDEFGSDTSAAHSVAVSGYQPFFDSTRGMWYADITVNADKTFSQPSYWPFIRLALARYQPASITNAHLSRVVQTDFVQIPPTRRARLVKNTARVYSLEISGYAPPAAPLPSPSEQGSVKPGPNKISVTIEFLPEGASPEFGWVRDTNSGIGPLEMALPKFQPTKTSAQKIVSLKTLRSATAVSSRKAQTYPASLKLTAATSLTGSITHVGGASSKIMGGIAHLFELPTLWEGAVTIGPETRRRRVVIEEFENYYADDPATLHPGQLPTATSNTIRQRLVYVDIFEL